ncbi:Nuclease associated modular domain 3 [uncultured Caudovirales phage]|uniref:Nuclease associated modular domain 3 n=1 Tax=uncultured Caudovirales phage TaxID=2100421 RepID=A0A6J5KZ27_9CAUD|nr:Nuclease associated modular domain 3 [uncultured Caudovirales phage]CAB5208637.1 Nuclease associated modular domain 3 [uncultured Caudovirales phage]
MNIYYVYQYLRKDNTPYYIGKGKGNRAWSKQRNIHLPADISRIELVKEQLTEIDAHNLEILLIAKYGRKDLGTGILYNRTDGGDGTSGAILSEETRAKMSAARKGKKLSEETRAKMSAVRKGRSNGCEGRTHSPETKAKMVAAQHKRYESVELRQHLSKMATEQHRIRKLNSLSDINTL